MATTCNCHSNNTNGVAQPKADYSKMLALTAVLNPQTVDRPGKKSKVLLYQSITKNGTLGVEQAVFYDPDTKLKSQGPGSGVLGNYGTASPMSPVLKFGSNLVSVVIDDIVYVYGVTAHDSSICMLSPVYQAWENAVIGPQIQGKIAGCTDGKGKGWIYYQVKDTDTRGTIYEKNLSKPNEKAVPIDESEKAKLGTDLVAFYDGKRRWVAYQNLLGGTRGTSVIEMVCGDDKKTILKIDTSSDQIDGQSIELAATVADNTKNGKKMIYIYFRDHKAQLHAYAADVVYPETPKFRGPLRINVAEGLDDLDQNSSLAVMPDKAGIVIYAVQKGSDKIEAFLDEYSD